MKINGVTSRLDPSWSPSTACAAASLRHLRQRLGRLSGRSRWASSSLWNDQHCRRASGMLNGGETTGADVLVASLGADSRLLEPLCATHVRGLQCFLDECCAPARAAHAFAHICGAGSDRSRARGPETCVSCANAAPSCIMAHFGLPRCVIREHEHCSTHPEACLDCQCHIRYMCGLSCFWRAHTSN